MEKINKKECPKCHGKNITKLAQSGSGEGNMYSQHTTYKYNSEDVFKCNKCGEKFSYKK